MRSGLLTLREVEEITRWSRATLYRRLRAGTLRGIKVDTGGWRIPVEEVERVLGQPPPSSQREGD